MTEGWHRRTRGRGYGLAPGQMTQACHGLQTGGGIADRLAAGGGLHANTGPESSNRECQGDQALPRNREYSGIHRGHCCKPATSPMLTENKALRIGGMSGA